MEEFSLYLLPWVEPDHDLSCSYLCSLSAEGMTDRVAPFKAFSLVELVRVALQHSPYTYLTSFLRSMGGCFS